MPSLQMPTNHHTFTATKRSLPFTSPIPGVPCFSTHPSVRIYSSFLPSYSSTPSAPTSPHAVRPPTARGMERRRRCFPSMVVAAAAFLMATMPSAGVAALSPDYYKDSCPDLESIVRYEVTKKKNETVVTIPATLRLIFHDCLVGGCDASVLIASRNNDAEKDASDNMSLAGDGFDTVNRVKAAVEKKCPGVVSCADIIALAARDVVDLASGPFWRVELGRLDGLVSKASDVAGKLPDPDMHVKELSTVFQRNGLSMVDLVALSGAHTVGFAHCTRFTNRLYYYSRSTATDPSFNPDYAEQLKQACPRNVGPTIAVNMDPVSPITFDNIYFANLVNGLGLFTSDQVLYTDKATRPIVKQFAANQTAFFDAFVHAMTKLGRLGVKTGNDGEIRRVCTAFNH
ncbi:peroxidase 55-like [Phragmites australis]|uniref:peroxidase 55-like n=1 Tax=Phragmites australis TaxID=29695 RepID=UPI002D76CF39|nr:peroxidase 55-like [Phragmites australis]